MTIKPKSTAGVLLREFGSLEKAALYAEKMAQRCADSRLTIAFEYQDAATQLRAALDKRTCTCHPDDNPPQPCPRKFAMEECRSSSGGGLND